MWELLLLLKALETPQPSAHAELGSGNLRGENEARFPFLLHLKESTSTCLAGGHAGISVKLILKPVKFTT